MFSPRHGTNTGFPSVKIVSGSMSTHLYSLWFPATSKASVPLMTVIVERNVLRLRSGRNTGPQSGLRSRAIGFEKPGHIKMPNVSGREIAIHLATSHRLDHTYFPDHFHPPLFGLYPFFWTLKFQPSSTTLRTSEKQHLQAVRMIAKAQHEKQAEG